MTTVEQSSNAILDYYIILHRKLIRHRAVLCDDQGMMYEEYVSYLCDPAPGDITKEIRDKVFFLHPKIHDINSALKQLQHSYNTVFPNKFLHDPDRG